MYVQVTISALNLQFQPNKLARSVEEAKLTAAEYTLTQIGFPVDGACVHGVCARTVWAVVCQQRGVKLVK